MKLRICVSMSSANLTIASTEKEKFGTPVLCPLSSPLSQHEEVYIGQRVST